MMPVREKLITKNLPLVISIASRYHTSMLPLEDLIQEGSIGLIHAAENFNPDKGFKFSTYATKCISCAISNALDRYVGKSVQVGSQMRVGRKCYVELSEQLQREPTVEEISAASGVPIRYINVSTVGEQALAYLSDESAQNAFSQVEDEMTYRSIVDMVKRLVLYPRDYIAFAMYYGIDRQDGMTISAVAEALHMSRTKVRSRIQEILDTVRKVTLVDLAA
jgi:RNA polymerase sigma factor (sigma-70 family)